MDYESKYQELWSLSIGFPLIKEVIMNPLGSKAFMGMYLPCIEKIYQSNPDALTEDLLFAVCCCGYPAPGVIAFLAHQKPELVINKAFEIGKFGYSYHESHGGIQRSNILRYNTDKKKFTLLEVLINRAQEMDQTEDDIKAVIDIWPGAIVEGEFMDGQVNTWISVPCIASMDLLSSMDLPALPFANNLIRYMSERLPQNLEQFMVPKQMFDENGVLNGLDDDCMVMINKVLHLPKLKQFKSEVYEWHQGAYVSFVEGVLHSNSLKELYLVFPAVGPSTNNNSLEVAFEELRSTAAELSSQSRLDSVIIDYDTFLHDATISQDFQLSTSAINWVCEMTKLRKLVIRGFSHYGPPLPSLPLLTQIFYNNNQQVPTYHSSLQSLTIDHNGIDDVDWDVEVAGLCPLLISLRNNNALEELVLNGLDPVTKVIYTDVLEGCVMMHNRCLKRVIFTPPRDRHDQVFLPEFPSCHSCARAALGVQFYTLLNRLLRTTDSLQSLTMMGPKYKKLVRVANRLASNNPKLLKLSDQFPRFKEVISSPLGTFIFLGVHLPRIETLYRAYPKDLTADLLFAVCICGSPAPGVIAFLARQKPEEVINNIFDINNFGRNPNNIIGYDSDLIPDKVTLLETLMDRELRQPGSMEHMEDDIKALIDIWPDAVTMGGDEWNPCIASMHLEAPLCNNLIRYMSEKLPQNLTKFELPNLFEDVEAGMFGPVEAELGIRHGLDDHCMIMINKVLHLPMIKKFKSEVFEWHQDAYVSFVEQVLQSNSLTELHLMLPAVCPSSNIDSLEMAFQDLHSTAAELASRSSVETLTIDYKTTEYWERDLLFDDFEVSTNAITWMSAMTNLRHLVLRGFNDYTTQLPFLPLLNQILINANNQVPTYQSSLQSLTIDYSDLDEWHFWGVDIAGICPILLTLKNNKTLEELVFTSLPPVAKVIYTDTLVGCVMMHNTSLKRVILAADPDDNYPGSWGDCHSCARATLGVQFYTLLNRCRGEVTSIPILVDVLSTAQDNEHVVVNDELDARVIIYYDLLQSSFDLWQGRLIA